jgi:hypothetical protein
MTDTAESKKIEYTITYMECAVVVQVNKVRVNRSTTFVEASGFSVSHSETTKLYKDKIVLGASRPAVLSFHDNFERDVWVERVKTALSAWAKSF